MTLKLFCVLAIIIYSLSEISCNANQINQKPFPPDFIFGAATSSYQIEGAWNISGKSKSIWDHFTRTQSHKILDRSNGDIACDSYHKYGEDVDLLKDLRAGFYRFSLSWSRILPDGTSHKINPDGIRYYNDVIDTLLENNIAPMITMFHWDLPQTLQDLGGFSNSLIIDWFEDYAKVVFDHFGDRVNLWITFNEPLVTCLLGFGKGWFPPGLESAGIGDYLSTHNLLRAHARVYRLYKEHYKAKQKGKVGITVPITWYEPASSSLQDIEAAQRQLDFEVGWFLDPILLPNGDYPEVMKKRIAFRSKAEGFSKSRLPQFTAEELEYIRGSYDFLGLNHYTTQMCTDKQEEAISDPSFDKDVRSSCYQKPEWPGAASKWLKIVPWGFKNTLKYLKKRYGAVEIYVTENGFSDYGDHFDDQDRIDYHEKYLSALLDAIYEDGVNVKGYAIWSLLDNFEWIFGYQNLFGIVHVNFTDPERTRTKKASFEYFRRMFLERKLPKRN